MTKKIFARLGVISVSLLCFTVEVKAATEFFYTSSPQSWVGAGQTVTVTPLNGFSFTPSRNFDNGVSFSINDFNTNPNFWEQRWWYLDFSAPFDAPLAVGIYQGATRWPFQAATEPGLDFSGNGRGNNTLTGSYNVLEVAYGASGAVESFAADFIQYDEGFQSWWNVGSIRFNSDVPITGVPEPSAPLLLSFGVAAVVAIARRRKLAELVAELGSERGNFQMKACSEAGLLGQWSKIPHSDPEGRKGPGSTFFFPTLFSLYVMRA
ncbi:MAG: PEP-CTERM sorting domain-containing protein [Rhodocyclaceae bacterium]|nr:PEP-CTERM sorting domain-containing protein [Rhodocyclaceae bacterium]